MITMRSREDNAIFTNIPIENIEFYKQTNEQLQQENQQLKEILSIKNCQLEEMELNKRNYKQENILTMKLSKLKHENQQLKDNWNKLKAWIKSGDEHYPEAIPFRETLRKMKELEGNNNV